MKSARGVFKETAEMSIPLAIVMIVLGFLAVFLPLATGIGVSILAGWLIVFGGFAYMAHAFAAHRAGTFLWRILIGIVYVIGGAYLAFNPGLALASLTLIMALIFFAESVLEIVVFFEFRALPGSGWILFNSIITFLLAYMIWSPWPSSSAWVIGTLLGINLIMSGFTRLMHSSSARKSLTAMA